MGEIYRSYKQAGPNKNFLQHFYYFFKSSQPLSREGFLYGTVMVTCLSLLGIFPLFLVLEMVGIAVGTGDEITGLIFGIVGIFILIPLLALVYLMARRLKDLDMHPYWVLPLCIALFIPVINFVFLAYLQLKPGVRGINYYGQRMEQGRAIIWRYYDRDKSLWQNIKGFYFTGKGRLNRLPFIWGNIILMLANEVASMIVLIPLTGSILWLALGKLATGQGVDPNGGLITFIGVAVIINFVISMIIYVMALYLQARRLHDLNYSAWYLILYLLAFVPFLGSIIILTGTLLLTVLKGTSGTNKFGADPLAEDREEVN